MDWRVFDAHKDDRGPGFYHTALEYGHYLWRHGYAARGILCLDRAMGADLRDDDSILKLYPIPYAAMAWFLSRTPSGVFIGNPRVHFQHYADRMNEPRRELRRARAWACWALTRRLKPSLAADPKHKVIEPTQTEITARLVFLGLKGEKDIWQRVWDGCAPEPTE